MPESSASTRARGSCMCGHVRFAAQFPSRFCCHCHCESCRRSHGAGFVTWIGFASPQLTVETGAADIVAYESSPGTRRSFCRRCGSKLFFESDKWPGETHVPLAAFDDAVDRLPDRHVFFDEHVAWIPWPRASEP